MSTLQSHHTVLKYCSPRLKGAEKWKFRVALIIGHVRHTRFWDFGTEWHTRDYINTCSHFVFLELVLLVLLFNKPWIHPLKGQKYSSGKLKARWLSFILQLTRFPTLWWFTTNSSSDDHLSSFKFSMQFIILLLLLVLPTLTSSTVLAREGLFLSFPFSLFFMFFCKFHPSNLLSAYLCLPPHPREGHLELSSPSHKYFLNHVLPYSLQMQSCPQDLNILLISLLVFSAYLSSSPDSQT